MNQLLFSKDHIKRFPRKIVRRYPRLKIEKATTKAGCVDLNKIRQMIEQDKIEKEKQNEKRKETKSKYNEIFSLFKDQYEEYFNAKFIANTNQRIVSYKNSDGKLIRRKYKTDRARFIEFYIHILNRYNINNDELKEYFKYAFKLSLREYEFTEQNKIFGVVISEKIADKYFLKQRKEKITKRDNMTLRERHKNLFND